MNEIHPLFPVNLVANWQHVSSFQLDDILADWLLDPNSLTERFKRHSQDFRIEVLGQRVESCSELEANRDIKAGESVLVREVLLYCDGTPHVFARSLLPLSSLTGEQQHLANIGNQSLGQVLFKNPDLERRNIEISLFKGPSDLTKLIQSLNLPTQKLLWGRRSLFYLQQKPLMVAEVFLPGTFAYNALAKKKNDSLTYDLY